MPVEPQPCPTELSDEQLLDRFVVEDDGEAFRTLVERHGQLVLNVCRRTLYSPSDAEDAFQATFLVLAESAPKIRRRESLAAWLYGVATRVSARMRRRTGENKHGECELMEHPTIEADPLRDLLARHDARIADEELAALPAKLRTPLVLRYVAGKTNAAVAKELGITVTALEGRLKRGKQRLRVRLLKRGVMLSTLVAVLKANHATAAAVPAALIEQTTLVCTGECLPSLTNLPTTAGGPDPTLILQLAREEIFAMKATLLIKPVAAITALGGLAVLTVAAQTAIAQDNGSSGAAVGISTGNAPVVLQAEAPSERADTNTNVVNPFIAQRPSNRVIAGPVPLPSRPPAPQPGNHDATGRAEAAAETNLPPTNATDPFIAPRGFDGLKGNQGVLSADGSFGVLGAPNKANRQSMLNNLRFADATPRGPMEARAEAALRAYLAEAVYDAPLQQVVEEYCGQLGINIIIDKRAFDRNGLDPSDMVSVNLKQVSFSSVLKQLLEPFGATYVVVDAGLLITTQEQADSMTEIRVYPFTTSEGAANAMNLLPEIVAPDSWRTNGTGEGAIEVMGDRLVIRQTYAVHNEINQLLLQLEGGKQAQLQSGSSRFAPGQAGILSGTLRSGAILAPAPAPNQSSSPQSSSPQPSSGFDSFSSESDSF